MCWRFAQLSPDKITRKATNEKGEEVEIKCDPAGPLVPQVYRTRIDPFVQKLSFIRIYSGTIKKDESVHVSGVKKNIKIGPLFEVQGGETKPLESASAGDIAAIAKTEDLHTGTTLGTFVMPPLKYPTPMVGLAAMPKARGDEAKLSRRIAQNCGRRSDVPRRSRFTDERTRDDRNERTAPDDLARTAQAAR